MTGLAKFMLFVYLFLVLRFGYATITWALSSHPAGALVPGVFLFLFASSLYIHLRYETGYESMVHSAGFLLIIGAASAISIVILWTLAQTRDDAVYRDLAVTMSFWGGATVLLAVLILAVSSSPGGRRRMREQRERLRSAGDAPPERP